MLRDKITNVFKILSFSLSIGILPASVASAGEPPATTPPKLTHARLTWEQAIRTALEKQPLIKIAQHDVLESQAVVKQIESANYPQVTGVYATTGGNTRVLANLGISGSLPKPVNYLTTPGLRVDLLITDFGHTANRILAQKSLTASAEKAVLTAKALVILTVEQAYLNCLKQRRLADVARQILRERELIREQADVLYRHQLRSKLDLDFASVEAHRAELALITAENDLKTAFAVLNNAMGLQPGAEYDLKDVPLSVISSPEMESLFPDALAKRPELLGSKDRLQATEQALQAAKALNFGHIAAIGTAGYTWWSREERLSGKEVSNPGSKLGWWGAGGTSSFPLYAGGRIQGKIEEAEARKGEVEASTRVMANDVVLQVAQAFLSRLTAEQQIPVVEQKIAHAREALALAQERYKVGLGSILDVVAATADLLSAEVGLATAQYDFLASDAALAYATGVEYGRY